jgi:hypothetical protein
MRIARFVRAKDAHVAPGDTLHNAAARMRTSGRGDNRLIGMVSARGLLAVQAQLHGVAV